VLPFDADAELLAGTLPAIHADPFDRGIIAAALLRKMPIATVDGIFADYAGPTGLIVAGHGKYANQT
jgi:PIN domain nuclease of toxin-antitoxin system